MGHAHELKNPVKNQKRVTISRIAELAGVSKATASLVLNGRSDEYRVAEETRQRVLAIAREHHYQPSIHARALSSGRSYTLGLVIPDLMNFGFAYTARELETLCREAGLQLLIACTDDNSAQEQMVVDALIQRQVDGLLVASSALSDQLYQKINQSLPVVQLDRHIGESTLPMVISDACQATAQVTQMLARHSPDEIYYFGGQLKLSPSRHRLAGYELGLKRAGITPPDHWIQHKDFQPRSGYDMMAELCNQLGRPPKALFTGSFTLLEGVLRYLQQHQLMEANIYLGSFDDHDLLDCLPLRIDSIAQDCPALAFHAFSLIQQLIAEQTPAQNAQVLAPRIRWRNPASIRLLNEARS